MIKKNIAILGLGEAGTLFANGLADLGFRVWAWDPNPTRDLHPAIQVAKNNLEASQQADIIWSVNLSEVSEEVAQEVKPCLNENRIYAELNTSSPDKKKAIEQLLKETGVLFADIAIMAPVPPKGIFSPFLASGPGALPLASLFQSYGLNFQTVEGEVGKASTLKLLRSIVYKGIAAVICEAMDAGKAFDQESYIREQITSIIGGQDELIDRFVEGSRNHAVRRIHEMEAVVQMLRNQGLIPIMSEAAKENLEKLIHH